MITKLKVLVLFVSVIFSSQDVFSQNADKIKSDDKSQTMLITSHSYAGSEGESAYIDLLRVAMNRNPESKGLFIFYCGQTCQYGEIEAHIRGINTSLRGKGWKDKEFLIINGGFRKEFNVEYWLVPDNSCLPIPNSTIDIKDVKFKGTHKGKFVAYDCCGY